MLSSATTSRSASSTNFENASFEEAKNDFINAAHSSLQKISPGEKTALEVIAAYNKKTYGESSAATLLQQLKNRVHALNLETNAESKISYALFEIVHSVVIALLIEKKETLESEFYETINSFWATLGNRAQKLHEDGERIRFSGISKCLYEKLLPPTN